MIWGVRFMYRIRLGSVTLTSDTSHLLKSSFFAWGFLSGAASVLLYFGFCFSLLFRFYFCFCHHDHLRGFSFLPITISWRQTLFTLVTTYRTGDISHRPAQAAADTFDLDLVVLIDEVDGTVANRNAVTCRPFLISWTRTHFRIAELGCLASTPTFSTLYPSPVERLPADPTSHRG